MAGGIIPAWTKPDPTMRLLFLPLLLAGLSACATSFTGGALGDTGPQQAIDAPQTVFIVVRHAEKGDDDPQDPALDAAGQARAEALSRVLADTALNAVYATPTRRTRATAAPVAAGRSLEVRDYDPALPASELATMLHIRHAGHTVLLVGHSNTVPDIVTALCACPVAPIDESRYGDLFRVRIDAGGSATLQRGRF